MFTLEKKQVLMAGDDPHGRAAARLLRQCGAQVTEFTGREVTLGSTKFDMAVVGPDVRGDSPLLTALRAAQIPIISDLELGFQQLRCLSIAVSGTSGKASTTALIADVLNHCGRKTAVAGYGSVPICEEIQKTRELDFLTVSASVFQLEQIKYFRPSIAVLMNIVHDHQDRFEKQSDYIRAKARLFQNQQPFDWAIVQSEAWAQMKILDLPMPAKVITFSARNQRADIFLDRGLLISRMDDWAGPLLDMGQTRFRGPHFAENLMAVLAVSRVLRLSLEETLSQIKRSKPLPNCCELVADVGGVKYINDARSNNLDALQSAVLAVPAERGQPNIWLIAGGGEKSLDYHAVGPLLSQRVKGAILFGKSREKLRAAWSLFTPCTLTDSLLEAVTQAAEKAVSGDTILFSPACSSSDQFQSDQHRGEVYRNSIAALAGATNGGSATSEHKISVASDPLN